MIQLESRNNLSGLIGKSVSDPKDLEFEFSKESKANSDVFVLLKNTKSSVGRILR